MNTTVLRTLTSLALLLSLGAAAQAQITSTNCGCMDIVLVVDNTGSMGGAIDNVKAELPAIINAAQDASGGDLRLGLITFPEDNVVVNLPFTSVIANAQAAVAAITLGGGAGLPESSDESLLFAVSGAADPSCSVTNGPLGAFRSNCVKIAVLITDAPPGGCHDTFTPGVDDVHATLVANTAAEAGVLVSAIYVPTSGTDPVVQAIMNSYADITGGVFVQTESSGVGTANGITDIIAACGGSSSTCITRPAQYWFTHPTGDTDACATLLRAIEASGGTLDLGFIQLPTGFRNGDNVQDSQDTLVEALGFYYRSSGKTGELGGTQSDNSPASPLCRERKRLAVELIAATANFRLLGTRPGSCGYLSGNTTTNFPSNLLQMARAAARGQDRNQIILMRTLLSQFNNSGVTNDFGNGRVECSPPSKPNVLRKLSRDPTSILNCPGVNSTCLSPTPVIFNNGGNRFASARFSDGANLLKLNTTDAFWKITPDVGATGRHFTVDTFGSNVNTVLTVFKGTCTLTISDSGIEGVDDSHLVQIVSNDNTNFTGQSQVTFTTDGTSTYVIQVHAPFAGSLKIHVTSP